MKKNQSIKERQFEEELRNRMGKYEVLRDEIKQQYEEVYK